MILRSHLGIINVLSSNALCIWLLVFSGGCRTLYDFSASVVHNFSTPRAVAHRVINSPRDSTRLSVVWIGHSTVLILIDDKIIITDPWLTNHVGELKNRLTEPGIDIDSLPSCEIILLSHSHFDHLNLGSLGLIAKRFPEAHLVFPEGLEEFLPNYSFSLEQMHKPSEKRREYIGESRLIDSVKITTVAAFHWGGRYGLDGLLWGSEDYTAYIIEYHGLTVYFAGDTGYDDEFFKILGKQYTIDLALVPIGPCDDPNSIHKQQRHVYPKGALKIVEDTQARIMVPIHYGTIYEPLEMYKPRDVLEDALKSSPDLQAKVRILEVGELYIVK